jgi:hypothetical protein
MVVDPTDRVFIAQEPTPQERGAQLEAFCRAIEREQFWDTARTLLACAFWSVSGVLAMAWSFSSTDERLAPVVFWGALVVSYSGIAFALIGAWRRQLERTGEW